MGGVFVTGGRWTDVMGTEDGTTRVGVDGQTCVVQLVHFNLAGPSCIARTFASRLELCDWLELIARAAGIGFYSQADGRSSSAGPT